MQELKICTKDDTSKTIRIKYVIIYLFIFYQVFVYASPVSTHFLVTHAGPCEKKSAFITTVKELAISTHNYDSNLSGEFNISEDVADGWAVKATVQKCQDIRNVDTCDHFRSLWVVRDGCADIDTSTDTDQLYTALFRHTTPQISCPVRGGTYEVRDYPVLSADNSLAVLEARVSSGVFGYKLTLEGSTHDRRELLCVEVYLQLLYMRDHNWLGRRRNETSITTPREDDD